VVPRIGAHRIHLRRYFHVAHRLVVGAGSPEQCERLVVIAEGDPDGGEGDGVEAFARRALAAPTRAYALIAEPVDPAVEAERLAFRRGYRDVLAEVLSAGVADGELEPHDTDTVAAALIGAIGEALVGPLSPAADHGPRRHESLIAALVQFCDNAFPRKEHKRAHARANA